VRFCFGESVSRFLDLLFGGDRYQPTCVAELLCCPGSGWVGTGLYRADFKFCGGYPNWVAGGFETGFLGQKRPFYSYIA